MPPLLFAPLWKLLGRCRIPCSHPLLPRSFIFMSCPIIPACFSYLYHLFFLPEPVPDAHGVRHFVSAGLFILHVLFCHLLFLTSQSSVFFLRGVIYKQKKPHSSWTSVSYCAACDFDIRFFRGVCQSRPSFLHFLSEFWQIIGHFPCFSWRFPLRLFVLSSELSNLSFIHIS